MCLISLVAATVETSKSKLEFCTIRLRKKGEFSVKITQHTLYTVFLRTIHTQGDLTQIFTTISNPIQGPTSTVSTSTNSTSTVFRAIGI